MLGCSPPQVRENGTLDFIHKSLFDWIVLGESIHSKPTARKDARFDVGPAGMAAGHLKWGGYFMSIAQRPLYRDAESARERLTHFASLQAACLSPLAAQPLESRHTAPTGGPEVWTAHRYVILHLCAALDWANLSSLLLNFDFWERVFDLGGMEFALVSDVAAAQAAAASAGWHLGPSVHAMSRQMRCAGSSQRVALCGWTLKL